MFPFRGGNLDCQRCDYELQGGESVCPRCQYSPRQRGLRVALTFLLGVVVFMTIVMFVPSLGPLLVGLAALSFVLCFSTLVISFFATPYRFGTVFLRL